ncbi:hypothetical protein QCA50_011713 [Cerrena zonata]|uniref:Cytochrome P450 n=1 Tax=Cerrena zonata TaxID=2478898 RepID=A0AAW0G0Y1_9APHY
MTTPIPKPPTIPFLGNVMNIDSDVPLMSQNLLARQYGEIYYLDLLGRTLVVVSSREFCNELSNEKRFLKAIGGGLREVRNGVGDGLFTAFPHEENWAIAHRILMPAFSTLAVRDMFDDMGDIVSQCVMKWERFGPSYKVDAAADFTRLTFDAISLCAMSYRVNSFYEPELHPFIQAMGDFLIESGRRAQRPGLVNTLMRGSASKYQEDIHTLMSLVDEIIAERKANPVDKKDLLYTMLEGKDPQTGKGLSIENIRNNLLTFLIAGHETTSGMLTFATYYLLKNPDTLQKLRGEIDTMIGNRPMTIDDVHKLPYLIAVMRETLRLAPTAAMRSVAALEDTTLGNGTYAIQKDQIVALNIYMVHRDPKIWGEDAESFRPERMLDGKFEQLPPNSWQPFGFGMRGCIGRPFAWQEAQMTLVAILQRFDLVMDDPTYTLQLKQTLTIKPKDFYIHAIPRNDKPKMTVSPSTITSQAMGTPSGITSTPAQSINEPRQPLYVLYGSNTGSSEAFAQRIASDAPSYGFQARIGTLDSAKDRIMTNGPTIIVTASFEGEPADNAQQFVSWLTDLRGEELKGIRYAVFGCGNRDWVATYQKIPTLIDTVAAEHGAERLLDRGAGDAGASDFFESFDKWETDLWAALAKVYSTKATSEDGGFKIETLETGSARAQLLRQPDTAFGTVIQNYVLTASGAPVKRHIEFSLPEGSTYRAGDYLAILPVNPPRDVHRAIARLGLAAEQEVSISSLGPSSLPVNKPITIFTLLSGYVELGQPATGRELRVLIGAANSDVTVSALKNLTPEELVSKRISLLDVLEDYPDINLSLGKFLEILPRMRIRQYSISSSPLWNPQQATLTISVIEAPSISGRKEPFLGVASTYLASLRPGDKVQMAVRASNMAFHLPADPTIPLVLICAGSGFAPLRGFLQERAYQALAGRPVEKSILFFGCRKASEDFLYSDSDLKRWVNLGIVDVRPAFSRAEQDSIGCKYVQDRIWSDRKDISEYFKKGAKFYLCGSSKVATGVKEKLAKLIEEVRQINEEDASDVLKQLMIGRFATDIFE